MNVPPEMSHIKHDYPSMVDVGEKPASTRFALACASIKLPSSITDLLSDGEFKTKKGPVFHTAIIAGTMAAKNTALLIPLCHTLSIDHINIEISIPMPGLICIECGVKSSGRTGVEMEALTGASIAALTIYDMCKSLTFDMEIVTTKLLKKTGGKHDRQHD